MTEMCFFFGVSRAAYYAWIKRMDEPDKDIKRLECVKQAHQSGHKTYGYRRITVILRQKYGLVINHKTVLRLMNKLGIRSVARKPNYFRRYAMMQQHHTYANVLDRSFDCVKPNQKWVTDITYISTTNGWCYLSVIKDLYDGFIIAHKLGRSNTVELVTSMVKNALIKEKVTDGLILHSDQGHQYTSTAYHGVLTKEYNITLSMSRKGNCWDNAPMENFFGQLKEEWIRQFPNSDFESTRAKIDE